MANLDFLPRMELVEKTAVSLENPEKDSNYVLQLDSQKCSNCNGQALIAASTCANTVQLFSKKNLSSSKSIRGHEDIITAICFGHRNPDNLYTASVDGTIKCWDFKNSLTQPKKEYKVPDVISKASILSIDISCDDRVLCVGTNLVHDVDTSIFEEDEEEENGEKEDTAFLLFWDCESGEYVGCYRECHSDDVTKVSFHPSNPDRLATGSTDGLICVFDISQNNEDDALQTVLSTESTVHYIGWCGKDLNRLYCLTHIESLQVWDTAETEKVVEINKIKEKYSKDVDYLVGCFEVAVSMSTEPQFHLVAGTHNGQITVFSIHGYDQLKHVCKLDGGHSKTVRCLLWETETNSLITGGEDAMLCLWQPKSSQSKETNGKSKSKLKTETRSKDRRSKKPY